MKSKKVNLRNRVLLNFLNCVIETQLSTFFASIEKNPSYHKLWRGLINPLRLKNKFKSKMSKMRKMTLGDLSREKVECTIGDFNKYSSFRDHLANSLVRV